MPDIVPLTELDPTAIAALLDRAFGVDRHGRTAYRLREGVAAVAGFSFAALEAGALVGSIQCWPVRHLAADGLASPLLLVGPVAVEPERHGHGVGRALMRHALAAIDAAGAPPQTLIGDPEYYGRFFGFSADRTGRWRLPGPFEQRRLLARGPAPDLAGVIGPAA